jgi:hypothetical protein
MFPTASLLALFKVSPAPVVPVVAGAPWPPGWRSWHTSMSQSAPSCSRASPSVGEMATPWNAMLPAAGAPAAARQSYGSEYARCKSERTPCPACSVRSAGANVVLGVVCIYVIYHNTATNFSNFLYPKYIFIFFYIRRGTVQRHRGSYFYFSLTPTVPKISSL